MSYDLTCKWNLINKTNKGAKYNERMEIKNKLAMTRGEGGEDNRKEGEVSSRNMYKGPTDKDNRVGGKIECGRLGWVEWRRVMG